MWILFASFFKRHVNFLLYSVFCCILIGLCFFATVVDIFHHLNNARESTEIIGDGDISMDKNVDETSPLLPNGSGQKMIIKDKTKGKYDCD